MSTADETRPVEGIVVPPNCRGSFDGVPIDYLAEYHEARRFMGERGTDMERLVQSIGLLYLNCPTSMSGAYESLFGEAMRRKIMMDFNPPPSA